MKRSIFLVVLSSLPLAADPADDYVSWIRQTQVQLVGADGPSWDIWDIEASGAATSPEGVGEHGSDFELKSIHSPTGEEYLLDSQYVASYAPSASVVIETGDPHLTVKRTRADKGYTVRVEIAGLINSADVTATTPVAAQQVLYTHQAYEYPDGMNTLEESMVTAQDVAQLYISGNGLYPANPGYQQFSVTNIVTDDITSVRGEEHISVTALADFGVAEAVIESAVVQIWPVASGTITGLDSNIHYKTVPPIGIQVYDLYPDSMTWAQVHPGGVGATPTADDIIILNDTVFLWNSSIPTDRTQSLSDMDEFLTKEGLHTIQLVHETPWGQEVLFEQEFSIDRTVQFKGNLISK